VKPSALRATRRELDQLLLFIRTALEETQILLWWCRGYQLVSLLEANWTESGTGVCRFSRRSLPFPAVQDGPWRRKPLGTVPPWEGMEKFPLRSQLEYGYFSSGQRGQPSSFRQLVWEGHRFFSTAPGWFAHAQARQPGGPFRRLGTLIFRKEFT